MSVLQAFGSEAVPSDYISVIEACYAPSLSHQAWAHGVLGALQAVVGPRETLGLVLVREREHIATLELSEFSNLRPPPGLTPRSTLEREQLECLRKTSGSLVPSQLFARQMPANWAAWTRQSVAEHRLDELWAAFARPTSDLRLMLLFGVTDPSAFARSQRDAYERIGIHVEAALRLRFAARERASAVVRLDGHVERMDPAALGLPKASVLVRGMRGIERAKRERDVASGERALRGWPALVEGNWSLVERTDPRGQRAYLAMLNPPVAHARRTLGEREAAILDLSSKGLSNIHVAYALGLSPSYVSSVLSATATRLGYKGRADLLRSVATHQAEPSRTVSVAELTLAERKVLELVQQGLSNYQIACARGTAERTVANQVAALMRKTGANSRRALIVMR